MHRQLLDFKAWRSLNEGVEVESGSILQELVRQGVPTANINLLNLVSENSWVLQISVNKRILASIQYPAMIDEIQSTDRSQANLIIGDRTQTLPISSAVSGAVTAYFNRKN